MKLYYLEDDLYPATYNFKDEADATAGTDIEFVDYAGTPASVTIESSLGDHRKVLKNTNTGGSHTFYNNITQRTSGEREFYFRTSDGTKQTNLKLREGATVICYIRLHGGNFKYYNGAVLTDTGITATNNIWFHLRMVWYADNTWDIYIDGIIKADGKIVSNNQVSGVDNFEVTTLDKDDYLDAIGDSWDTDYNISDNREVDWHDPYNKEEITDIETYPTITQRLNYYCQCNAVLGDFEGAKFDDWSARDFNKILIEDDSDNIIFRGFLTKKIFTKKSLTLYFVGFGALLDWSPFGSDGSRTYVLAEGLVDVPIPATSILTLKDGDGNPMGWDADWWISDGFDVGILIVDKTAVNTRTWVSSAVSQTGGTIIVGNNASILTFNDDNYLGVKDTDLNPDIIITPVIDDGIAIDDTAFLKSIEIQFNFRFKISVGIFAYHYGKVRLQILKDTEWITKATKSFSTYWGNTGAWKMGIPSDEYVGGNDAEILIEDTDAELRKYFTKVGATYDKLKGLRFKTTGDIKNGGYLTVHVDYIKAKIGYTSTDISPIMETITDNAGSTVTCEDVSKWDESGVVEDDGFRIGQNTRAITEDIGDDAELDIGLTDPHDLEAEGNVVVVLDGTEAGGWVLDGGGTHHGNLEDDNDGTGIKAEDTEESAVDTLTCTTTHLKKGYVHKVTVLTRGLKDTDLNPTVSIWNGDSWEDEQEVPLEVGVDWHTNTFEDLIMTQENVNDLKIRYTAPATIPLAKGVWIYEAEIHVHELYSIFNKYMARVFKGSRCMEPLRAVCKLEGALWYEDYINGKIMLVKPADLVDSGVDLTEADYNAPWEYEDKCNQVKSFFVFGKSEDNIFAKAVDETVKGYISEQLIDESITNVADAQEIADAQLALVNSKRPSIKLPLKADNVALQLGTTVDVTFARPTIAKAAYPIRKLERKKKGINDIALTIWIGLGESSEVEDVTKFIRDNMFRSHKALTDRLISP